MLKTIVIVYLIPFIGTLCLGVQYYVLSSDMFKQIDMLSDAVLEEKHTRQEYEKAWVSVQRIIDGTQFSSIIEFVNSYANTIEEMAENLRFLNYGKETTLTVQLKNHANKLRTTIAAALGEPVDPVKIQEFDCGS